MSSEPWVKLLNLGEAERASRLSFLGIDEESRRLLRELREALTPHAQSLVDEWHRCLLARSESRDLLARGRVQEHLRTAQARYFGTLLTGPYDEAYFEERLRIGFIHERVGLEPVWYIGSYGMYQDLVRRSLTGAGHDPQVICRWLGALEKVVYLDMELALDAYFYSKNREILRANEALGQMARRLEERNVELTRQFERAQEASRAKEQFLSKVSHELRTPLSAIMGFADLMADGIDGPVNETQARSLRKIRLQGERMLAMVDQVIDAAKMAAAGIAEPLPFDPTPVLREAVAAAARAAAAKGLGFESRIAAALPRVLGDREGFALSLDHLLENAVKFTKAGSIHLAAEGSGDTVRFTVSDTGPGIPEAHRDRIFEPFYQVESGDTRAVTGLGMGLTLARQAMERMGGTLELAATGPGGSTFAIELPAR